MSGDNKPADNLIQEEEAAQLKALVESLLHDLKDAAYEAQDAVLDDLNHGLLRGNDRSGRTNRVGKPGGLPSPLRTNLAAPGSVR